MSNKFRLVSSQVIRVDERYCHERQVGEFTAKRIGSMAVIRDGFADATFAKTEPIPQGELNVQSFELDGAVTLAECEAFFLKQKSLRLGAQGLTLAVDEKVFMVPSSRNGDFKAITLGHVDDPIPCIGCAWLGQELIGFFRRVEIGALTKIGGKGDVVLVFNQMK